MQLYTIHKVLIIFAMLFSAAIVAWGLHHFTSEGNTKGALLAGFGAISGGGFGFYLRGFWNTTKG